MPAPEIDAVLEQLEGSISDEIYYRGLHSSPWLDLTEYSDWPEGQGNVIQSLTYDRSLPSNPLNWVDVGVSGGEEGGACIPPVQRLEITKTLREFKLQHTALESPDLCVNDLRDSFQAEEQMEMIMNILGENTRQGWIDRNRNEYVAACDHKMIALQSGLIEDDVWLDTEPNTILSGAMLKRIYAKMVRLGGGKNSYGSVNGRPTFVAVTGMETSERIVMEEPNRSDLRYSDRVPELLAPLGVERLFKGFWMIDDVFPPRWNFTGGEWVNVPPYIWTGGKLEENPDYDSADYEDTIVYHMDVVRTMIPKPQRNFGQAAFDPVKFRGDWRWLNIQHRTDNPDKNNGFFRGVFSSGSKKKFPQYGFTVRHLRCDLPLDAAACNES